MSPDHVAARLEQEIEQFRAAHPLLMERARLDPDFAERWDRAVRQQISTDLMARPAPVPKGAPKVRRSVASRRLRAARREEYRKAVEAYQQAFLDELTASEIARLRSQAKAALAIERRRLHDELADRRLEGLRRRADGLPVAGPEREAVFRRWVIEDAERRGRRGSRP